MESPEINSYIISEDRKVTLKISEEGRINNWYWDN